MGGDRDGVVVRAWGVMMKEVDERFGGLGDWGVRCMCEMAFARSFDAEAEVDGLDMLAFSCVGELVSWLIGSEVVEVESRVTRVEGGGACEGMSGVVM